MLDMTCREEHACLLELRSRSDKPVMVRVPGWTRPDDIRVTCNDIPIHYNRSGEWITLEPHACKDKTVEVRLPMPDRTETSRVAALEYDIEWHGSLVRQVTRTDGSTPLRGHYKRHFIP
jgi:DUF1680 family protein